MGEGFSEEVVNEFKPNSQFEELSQHVGGTEKSIPERRNDTLHWGPKVASVVSLA